MTNLNTGTINNKSVTTLLSPSILSPSPKIAEEATSITTTCLTMERKRELLIEARHSRSSWVLNDSSLFRSFSSSKSSSPSSLSISSSNGGIAILKRCKANIDMGKNVTNAVLALYGLSSSPSPSSTSSSRDKDKADNEKKSLSSSRYYYDNYSQDDPTLEAIDQRIKKQFEAHTLFNEFEHSIPYLSGDDNDDNGNSMTNNQDDKDQTVTEVLITTTASKPIIISGEEERTTITKSNNNEERRIYYNMLRALCTPECSEMVQSMRNFVRNFERIVCNTLVVTTIPTKKKQKQQPQQQQKQQLDETMIRLVISIKRYLATLRIMVENRNIKNRSNQLQQQQKLLQLPSWDTGLLESFLYRKCLKSIYDLLLFKLPLSPKSKKKEYIGEGEKNIVVDNVDNNDKGLWAREMRWKERMDLLRFVTPTHLGLGIGLLTTTLTTATTATIDNNNNDNDNDNDNENENESNSDEIKQWENILSKAIQSIQYIHNQCSPRRMIQCILDVYRGVSEALLLLAVELSNEEGRKQPQQQPQQQQQQQRKSGPSSSLPPSIGADDVLPALIFSLIRAKPGHILSDLRFVELFGTGIEISPVSGGGSDVDGGCNSNGNGTILGGEAGYAFTTLCGAIQFVEGLRLDMAETNGFGSRVTTGDGNGESLRESTISQLSISAKDWKEGLEKCRLEANERRRCIEVAKVKVAIKTDNGDGTDRVVVNNLGRCHVNEVATTTMVTHNLTIPEIPVREIRAARLNGQEINIEWVKRWQEQYNHNRNSDNDDFTII